LADESIERLIDMAFEYRGDVTLDRTDGTQLAGYLFNRNGSGAQPYAQIETAEGVRHRIAYADVKNVRFTGKDMAAGKSYEAWKRRREVQARASDARE
jgi:hypothetical protein